MRALTNFTGDKDENEQNQSGKKPPRRPATKEVGRQLREDQHADERDTEAYDLVEPEAHVLADGAVKNDESQRTDQQQAAEQRAVDVQAPDQAAKVGQRRHFLARDERLRIAKLHRRRTPGTCP